MYGVCNPKDTSVGSLIEMFSQNYECKQLPISNIGFYLSETERYIEDLDPKTKLSELEFSSDRFISICMVNKSYHWAMKKLKKMKN